MNISLVLSFSGWLFCSGVLKKDTTVWLDGARPVNTCIPPSILGNVPVQQQRTHKQKYVCEYMKIDVCQSKKRFFFSFVKSDSNIIKVIERSIIMDFGMNLLK